MEHENQGKPADLAALVGSRICHDLVNPLGALANGLELLAMEAPKLGDMAGLLSDSLNAATARVQFFRVAFGAAPAERMPEAQIRETLAAYTAGKRLRIDWQAAGDRARAEARLTFLVLMCLEAAMPRGGRITVTADGPRLALRAEAADLRHDSAHWQALAQGQPMPHTTPAEVQFALAAAAIDSFPRAVTVTLAPGAAAILI